MLKPTEVCIKDIRKTKQETERKVLSFITGECEKFREETGLKVKTVQVYSHKNYPIDETDNPDILNNNPIVSYSIKLVVEDI